MLFLRKDRRYEVLLAMQVRVLLLAGVPGSLMEERPQGHMQADPADAEDQEIVTDDTSRINSTEQRPQGPKAATGPHASRFDRGNLRN